MEGRNLGPLSCALEEFCEFLSSIGSGQNAFVMTGNGQTAFFHSMRGVTCFQFKIVT